MREYIRHQGHCNRGAQQSQAREASRDGSAKTATASEETGKEGDRLKEEGDEDKHPSETPEQKVLGRGAVTITAADQRVRCTGGVRAPGATDGGSRTSTAAILVSSTADVEKGPLGDVAGAGNVACVGAEEVGLVEGRGVVKARENNKPEEEEGRGEENEGREAEGSVCMPRLVVMFGFWCLGATLTLCHCD